MANIQFANYAAAQVTAAVPAVGTSLAFTYVTNASPFPTVAAPQYFYLTLIDAGSYGSGLSPPGQREIVKVINYAGGNTPLTIVRGQDGTTPQTWSPGDRIELRLNAAAMVDTIGTAMSTNSANLTTSDWRAQVTPNSNYDISGIVASSIQFNGSVAPTGGQQWEGITFRNLTSNVTGPSWATCMAFVHNGSPIDSASNCYGIIGSVTSLLGSGKITPFYGRAVIDGTFSGTAVAATFGVTYNTGATPGGTSCIINVESSGTNVAAFPIGIYLTSNTPGVGGIANFCVVDSSVTIAASCYQWNQRAGLNPAVRFLTMNDPSTAEIFAVDINGNVLIRKAGSSIQVKEGSNARMGVATMVGGTVTVANTSITATTRIQFSIVAAGGTQGFWTTTRINGTSFTVTSTQASETSTFTWFLIEPAT